MNPYTLREMAFRVSTADGKMLFSCADAWEAGNAVAAGLEHANAHLLDENVALRQRLEAARRAWREGNYPGLEAALAAGEEKPDGWILSDGHRAGHG